MMKLKTESDDKGKIMDDVLTLLCVNDDDAPTLGDKSSTLSKEEHFRQAVNDEYIKPRTVALNAMKEGMTLRGTFPTRLQYCYIKNCL
jgi:hypothetical protein